AARVPRARALDRSLWRELGLLAAHHGWIRRGLRHRATGRRVPARRLPGGPGRAPDGVASAGAGLAGESARGEAVLLVLPAVLFLRAWRSRAARCAELRGHGHRGGTDDHAGAAACAGDLDDAPAA